MHRPTQYSTTLDRFLSPYGVFTCEEVDDIDRLEKEWKESLPDYSFQELLEIFPQAKSVAKKNLKDEIKKCTEDLLEAERIEIEGKNLIQWKSREKNHWFWEGVLEVLLINPLRKGKEEIIKRNNFYLNSMKKREEEIATSGVTEIQIREAKQVPIQTFIKVNRNRKAICLFHNDSDPSMHIYKDNHYYCFVCNASGDVVDLVMKLRNVSFIDAVKSLL